MKQKIINLYTFDELNEEQQKKVLDNNRDYLLDILTTEDIIWNFSEVGQLVADAGFLNPEFEYDVSYVQGRGACFDCSEFNWDLLLADLEIPHKSLVIKIIEQYGSYSIERPNVSFAYHYSHENCRRFYLNWGYDYSRINHLLYKVQAHIEQKRHDLCIEVRDKLTETYEYLQSDECLKEHMDLDDIYFNPETGISDTPNVDNYSNTTISISRSTRDVVRVSRYYKEAYDAFGNPTTDHMFIKCKDGLEALKISNELFLMFKAARGFADVEIDNTFSREVKEEES